MMDGNTMILVAKIGLDGHDRGAKVVARALREAGLTVRYTGLHLDPESVARMAVDSGADVLGVSIHSGAHGMLVPELLRHLALLGAADLPVVIGGTVPEDDRRALMAQGVRAVFGAGASLATITDCCRSLATGRRALRAVG